MLFITSIEGIKGFLPNLRNLSAKELGSGHGAELWRQCLVTRQ